MKKEEPGEAFVTYRFEDGEALSTQLLGSPDEARMKIRDEQRFSIQGEGDRFSEANIRSDTLGAFFCFLGKYEDALRRLS